MGLNYNQMLKKYRIKQASVVQAAGELHNVNGRTVYLKAEELEDADAKCLMANGCEYFELAKQPNDANLNKD